MTGAQRSRLTSPVKRRNLTSMHKTSQPYREPSTSEALPNSPKESIVPYRVAGKSETEDGYLVHLAIDTTTVRMVVDRATFYETIVGERVFVRLEKARP
jgi:hypothetical protein